MMTPDFTLDLIFMVGLLVGGLRFLDPRVAQKKKIPEGARPRQARAGAPSNWEILIGRDRRSGRIQATDRPAPA